MSNTFVLCVTGSTQGTYAPHKRATHVQWAKLNIFITIQRLQEKKIMTSKRTNHRVLDGLYNYAVFGLYCFITFGFTKVCGFARKRLFTPPKCGILGDLTPKIRCDINAPSKDTSLRGNTSWRIDRQNLSIGCWDIAIFHYYRTGGVSRRRASRSVTRDNAQLPMLSKPCSCWPVAASVGSGH